MPGHATGGNPAVSRGNAPRYGAESGMRIYDSDEVVIWSVRGRFRGRKACDEMRAVPNVAAGEEDAEFGVEEAEFESEEAEFVEKPNEFGDA